MGVPLLRLPRMKATRLWSAPSIASTADSASAAAPGSSGYEARRHQSPSGFWTDSSTRTYGTLRYSSAVTWNDQYVSELKTEGERNAACRGERVRHARRPGDPDGRADAAVLGPGDAVLRAAEARLPTGPGPAAGRAVDRLPRHRRSRGPARQPLPAPRCLLLLRAERGGRPAVRVPRLEVRR